jgi:mannose-6-phosphate isomerase-like protein (cupin superfamily)
MKKIQIEKCKTYEAPGHVKMVAMRLAGKEETGNQKFWMGLSHFLPGGGAAWAYEDNPMEKVYFVLSGHLTVKTKSEEIVVGPMEGVFLGPNEGREIWNKTNMPVSMLVIINY